MSPEIEKFISQLESELGYAEKNSGHTKFGKWYNSVESDSDYSSQPWCDMYISWAAQKLGYQEWVGQFAWTVSHARWFEKQDAWGHTPEPGALVFYDWSGGDDITGIDHVGVVTKVTGKKIHTIEGNIDGGVAKRKVRDESKVVGYGYPEKVREQLQKRELLDATTGDRAEAATGTLNGPGLPDSGHRSLIPDVDAELPPPPPEASPKGELTGKSREPAQPAAKSAEPGTAKPRADKPSTGEPRTETDQQAKPEPAPQPSPRAGLSAPPEGGRTTDDQPTAGETTNVTGIPLSAVQPLHSEPPNLGTPAILAPVLLAALALIAHTKTKQSRVRLATALAVPAGPSRRRTPGKRRAPRRTARRTTAPGTTPSTTPATGTRTTTTLPTTEPAPQTWPTTESITPESVTLGQTTMEPALHTRPAPEPAAPGPATTGPALRTRPAPEPAAPTPATGPTLQELPAVESAVAGVPALEPVSGDLPGRSTTPPPVPPEQSPYQGRRRRECPVEETSTFVPEQHPRGRRHRSAVPSRRVAAPSTAWDVFDLATGWDIPEAETPWSPFQPVGDSPDLPLRGRRHRRSHGDVLDLTPAVPGVGERGGRHSRV
ncbi:CHAP domain-containing protein [Streptosporangium sp. KLBMP 9127]|nr:CHAP domain-containing protein [Streptosporangium sp. KLBMP 9127]